MNKYFCDSCNKELESKINSMVSIDYLLEEKGKVWFDLCIECKLILKNGIIKILRDMKIKKEKK